MIQVRFAMMLAALAVVLVVLGVAVISILPDKEPIQPPDACREASTALYGHVSKLFDPIAQAALINGGFIGYYELHSDGEVFPRVWYDFVQACVPPVPVEGGAG